MGILGALFGGSKNKSTSENKAFGQLQGALTPAVTTGVNALNEAGAGLGTFDDYKRNAGFDYALGEGLSDITGARAAMGALRSGSTGEAYQDRAMNIGSQFYDNWLNKKLGISQLGLGAAGTLAGAGQTSTSKGSSNGGIIPGLFSDRRLKTDITEVGRLHNGLPVYAYRYIDGGPMQIGLMADEVEQLHPDAVAEAKTWFSDGVFKTVDYGKAVL